MSLEEFYSRIEKSEEAIKKGLPLPEERPLFSLPDEEVPDSFKNRDVDVPLPFKNGWFSTAGTRTI